MEKQPSQIPFVIQRNVLDREDLNAKAHYEIPSTSHLRTLIEGLKKMNYRKSIQSAIPILQWLPNYWWEKDLASDIICGFTVAIMHIPQGMSYAILAHLDPIIGIYMGFFPVFVYAIFGSSRHVSIGTFAVLSLMCGHSIVNHTKAEASPKYSNLDVATALSINVGLIQLLMYVFRLGVVSTLLSDPMVNAFTCAASFHVLTAQLHDLFGVKLPDRGDFAKVILVFFDIAEAFPKSNWTTFSMSVVFFAILVIYIEVIKPRLAQKTNVPFPIELACVILGTIVSYHMQLQQKYQVEIVGTVPTGLPHFKLPPLALMGLVAGDSVAIAIISYTITFSMGLIFAQKQGYEIQPNQELLALGLGNLVGGFFSCMPSAASISRSVLQEGVGGVTQLASIICCGFLLTVMLYIAPLFTQLPMCVLACIIIVYLKSTLLQVTSLKKYWFLNKWDFAVWLMTFTTTILVDVTLGLVCGICISLFSVFARGQQPHTAILAGFPKSGLYLDVNYYGAVTEVEGLKIFSYHGTLSYLTKDIFKATLITKTGINPFCIMEKRSKMKEPQLGPPTDTMGIKCIVIDFSGVSYIDPSGVSMLIGVVATFGRIGVVLFASGFTVNVLEDLKKCEKYDNKCFLPSGMEDEHLQPRATLRVQRPVYQTEELNEVTTYQYEDTTVVTALKGQCSSFSPKNCLYDTIPILRWLPAYKFKKNIMGDLFSGITVATMHIPQGMAYAFLGNVPPIVGIYMAFFPVLVYFVFGTSRHVSMGTFAVICLMTGKTVSEYSVDEYAVNATAVAVEYEPMQVATTVTFTVALIQMIMYIFRLGIITTLLSETLVNAFTCASAFHVVMSQLKDLLGLTLARRKGIFSLVNTLYDICLALPQANVAAIVISSIFIIVMVINNEILKPILAKKTKIPIPIELVAVITGTSISYGMNFNKNYAVNVVGYVPTGFPNPDPPIFSLIPSIIVDSFIITMVSYTITMSMALIVAQKDHYEVDPNQELLALSLSNCFGSFFSCMPITASLSRTMIQQAVGGVTQIASVVSCFILLFVLLWIGPLFESLPRCVLASIIVVALKSMIVQCLSLKRYWKLSKWDALVWIVTFFTTTIVSIDYGLLAGIIVSLASIFIQGQKCYTCLLGVVPNTDLYLDVQRYKGIQELSGIKIFHYSGSLNFASKSAFKSLLFKKTGFDPVALNTKRKEDLELNQYSISTEDEVLVSQCIILDFTALTYVDPSGVETLRSLFDSYRSIDVTMYICGCSGPVFETFKRCERYRDKDTKFMIFPTVHDAVLYCQSLLNTKTR